MNFYYFLLFFSFFTSKTALIKSIEKQIKKIEEITEKIINIEHFLDVLENESNKADEQPIQRLFNFLEENSLFFKHPDKKKTYSFHEITFLLNEHALINYIRKNATQKEEIENILIDAFGEQAKKEITFFLDILFIKIKTMEEKEREKKLLKTEKKQIAKIKESEQIQKEQEKKEKINQLILELKAKNLFLTDPEPKQKQNNKIYLFNEFLLFLNKPKLIAYINNNEIQKETIENMFIDAFGEQARLEIQSFFTDIFAKAEREKKKISLTEEDELQKNNIDENVKNLMTESKKEGIKLTKKVTTEVKKQEETLEARLALRKKKNK